MYPDKKIMTTVLPTNSVHWMVEHTKGLSTEMHVIQG